MRTRFERKPITGAGKGWTINSAGIAYRNQRALPISKDIAGLPTLDMGGDYAGPVPPPGNFEDTVRLLDEIVCYEFHGVPVDGFWSTHVLHLDGDVNNCAADNLAWATDEEFMRARQEKVVRRWMRPDFLPAPIVRLRLNASHERPAGEGISPNWVSAPSVEGWRSPEPLTRGES